MVNMPMNMDFKIIRLIKIKTINETNILYNNILLVIIYYSGLSLSNL